MAESKSVRLNSADNPNRQEDFEKAVTRSSTNGNAVLRRLVDAFNLYVKEHGHAPAFPVRLEPISPPKKKR